MVSKEKYAQKALENAKQVYYQKAALQEEMDRLDVLLKASIEFAFINMEDLPEDAKSINFEELQFQRKTYTEYDAETFVDVYKDKAQALFAKDTEAYMDKWKPKTTDIAKSFSDEESGLLDELIVSTETRYTVREKDSDSSSE